HTRTNHHLHSFPTRRSSDLPETDKDIVDCCATDSEIDRQSTAAALQFKEYFLAHRDEHGGLAIWISGPDPYPEGRMVIGIKRGRSEEHTSELQSRSDLVCRL